MEIKHIPVKFDIWDTHYTIEDYGDHLIVTMLFRKYYGPNTWKLGRYKKEVTQKEYIELVRKAADNEQFALFAKEGLAHFSIEEIIGGIPTEKGWTVDDFE